MINILVKFTKLVTKIFEDLQSVFTLAKLASAEKVDLSKLNRTQYTNYAEYKNIYLDDGDLRLKPELRNCTDKQHMQQILDDDEKNYKPSQELYQLLQSHKHNSGTFILPKIQVHPQTQNSKMWIYYNINGGLSDELHVIPKSYIGLKHIDNVSSLEWMNFLKQLQKNGFEGSIKTALNPLDVKKTSDQIVMHGNTKLHAEIGLQTAEQIFKDQITFKDQGADRLFNNKWYSHAQWIAKNHKDWLDKKRRVHQLD